MLVVVGHTCGGHRLSDVGLVYFWMRPVNSCLSLNKTFDLTSAWSEMNIRAQVRPLCIGETSRR